MVLSNLLHSLLLSSAVFTTLVNAGHGGPGGRHGGPPPPPFLRNVTDEGRRAYFDISRNQNLTLAQIDNQTSQWAQTYGVSAQYNRFKANSTAHRQQVQQNVTSIISNLSAAQTALKTVLNDRNQTRQQQLEAINQLMKQYPQEIPALFFISKPLRKGPKSPRGPPEGRRDSGGQGQGRKGQNQLMVFDENYQVVDYLQDYDF